MIKRYNFRKILVIVCFLSFCIVSAKFLDLDYDLAIYAGQQGKLDNAKQKLQKLVVHRPKDPDLLYDSGVISFKSKEYTQAQAYFKSAAESEKSSQELKERALFNLGNTNVQLDNLQEAIKNYEDVLKINPENKQAKSNLEIVKKMLEQKKQDQDKNKKEKEKSGDQEQQKDGTDKDKGKDGSNQDKKNKEGKQPRSDEQRSDESKDEQGDKGETPKEDLDKKRDEKQKKDGQSHDQKPNQKKDEKSNIKHDDDKMKNKKDQAKLDDEKNGNKKNKEDSQDQEPLSSKPVGAQESKKLDKRTQKALEYIQKQDESNNKELIKAIIKQNMGGQHGQNHW